MSASTTTSEKRIGQEGQGEVNVQGASDAEGHYDVDEFPIGMGKSLLLQAAGKTMEKCRNI